MSRGTSSNYPNNFPLVVGGGELFHKEDVQSVQAALEAHRHDGHGATGGLSVLALGNGIATGAALGTDVVTLAAVQSITGAKTFTALKLLGATTPTAAGQMGFNSPFANVGDGTTNHPLVDTNSVQAITGLKTITNPTLIGVPVLAARIDDDGLTLNNGWNQAGALTLPMVARKIVGWVAANYTQYHPTRKAYYVVGGTVAFDTNPSGARGVAVVVNGTAYVAATVVVATQPFGNALTVVSEPLLLDVTDTIELQIYAEAFDNGLSPVAVTVPHGSIANLGRGDLWAICVSGDTT